jgi:hypothetical protein
MSGGWFTKRATVNARKELQRALDQADFARDILRERYETHGAVMLEAWEEMVMARALNGCLAESAERLAEDKHMDARARQKEVARRIGVMTKWIEEVQTMLDDKVCDDAMVAAKVPIEVLERNLAPDKVFDALEALLKSRSASSTKAVTVEEALREKRVEEEANSEKAAAGEDNQKYREELRNKAVEAAVSRVQLQMAGVPTPRIPMPTPEEMRTTAALRALAG